jgi:hypothetical protein
MPLLTGSRMARGSVSLRSGGNFFVVAAATVLGGMLTSSPAEAQTPATTPAYTLHCSDCSGTEYFGDLLAADTDDCQHYQANRFENWTAEGTSAPDQKFVAASQADIVEVNTTTDANFVYYQVVTRATTWSSVLVQSLNIELAFGDCSLATTRFNVLAGYALTSADVGNTWRPQGNAQIKMYRDDDSGNNRIGDMTNDGPAAPVGNTSNFNSNDDGYNVDVVVAAADAYSRLTVSGGNANIEIAIRRTAAVLTALHNPFTPCFGRAWTGQTSTISKDAFAINDQRPTTDFTSTSSAMDNCSVAAESDPCDPAPDCTSFDTPCGIASCDPGGADGNCAILTARSNGTVCRADAGDCDVAETCDGVNTGACPANAFEANGVSCGSASDTICDNADTCNGSGTCLTNNEPGTTVCRADAGQCDVVENCDGAGSCPADAFEPNGTSCGNPSDTICDNADTCNGLGSCVLNNEPGSTVCRADAGECDVAENCDGAGSCPGDAFEANGVSCGSASDTICDNADTCNGGGTCLPNNEPGGTLCRADAGDCDIAETCDGAGSCPADTFESPGTSCGSASDTICDNADTCDGSGTCDPNPEPGATLCRVDAGECDVAESCDGAGACPADAFEPADTACGSASDTICDNADTCDGNGTCDTNNEPGATVCRADAGDCDVEETCDGAGACPADAFEPEDTACGSASDTICDNADTCDGNGTCDTNNEPGATLCRADAGDCDVEETCDGAGACPADAFEPQDTACGSASDTICDNADTCDGNGTCDTNNEPGVTVCRADAGECDVEETCDGAGACPADAFEPEDTACGSASDTICDNADTCDGNGTCDTNNEPGATVCRADAGECDVEETCDGAGACPDDAFEPEDTSCGSASDTICDNADTCDGNGTCDSNNESAATLCRADAGQCDVAETCDGAGACPTDAFEPADTACGNPADSICDNADTCDGNGACETNNEPGSTLCRADAGECDVAESCDGAGACPADAFEPEDTACGSASDTICDDADTCDGNGTCDPNNEPGATLCRADAGECDVAETCDGSGACPDDVFEPEDTACGSASDTICDNADTCDGNGTCETNNEPGATLCRADAGECDIAETCDGAGSCPDDAFEPEDTSCGSASDTICDNADSCDGNGTCDPNNEPGATLCRDDAGECDVAESCDGSGSCPADAFEPEDTACGSASDTICDNADTCDGNGTCDPNNEPGSTLCRDDAGECDVAETCDGSGACPADAFEPDDTACGSADDTICDNADTCDGNGTCDPNNEPGATLCRDDAGECDVAESCDGAGSCPADAFEPADTSCGSAGETICDNADSCDGNGACQANNEPGTTECRSTIDACDVAESCDGSGNCPDDSLATEGTECRSATDLCDVAEECDGVVAACPADAVADEGTECRGLAGGCDVAEACDGASVECPADDIQPVSTECRGSAGSCDLVEICDGSVAACPEDAFEPASLECRGAGDICDAAESCTGTDGACPSDGFQPASTLCRASASQCDRAETCTGAAAACPANTPEPMGTVCDDANACTTEDSCSGFACEPGEPLDCDDGDLCTFHSCDTEVGCVYEPDVREPETCYNSAAGRLVITDRDFAAKDGVRWTWYKGDVVPVEAFGSPGTTTAYSLCIFDRSAGETTLATSLVIPVDAPFWKPPKAGRIRYVNRPGVFDGVRRIRAQARSTPLKSRIVLRARGINTALPIPVSASQFMSVDPSLTVQLVNSEDECWSTEFTPADTRKNTVIKYRGFFR